MKLLISSVELLILSQPTSICQDTEMSEFNRETYKYIFNKVHLGYTYIDQTDYEGCPESIQLRNVRSRV